MQADGYGSTNESIPLVSQADEDYGIDMFDSVMFEHTLVVQSHHDSNPNFDALWEMQKAKDEGWSRDGLSGDAAAMNQMRYGATDELFLCSLKPIASITWLVLRRDELHRSCRKDARVAEHQFAYARSSLIVLGCILRECLSCRRVVGTALVCCPGLICCILRPWRIRQPVREIMRCVP